MDKKDEDKNWVYDLVNWAWDAVVKAKPGRVPEVLGSTGKLVADWLPGATAEDLARDYQKDGVPVDEAIDAFIRWQCAHAGAVGFAAGAPGLMLAGIAIPAELAAVTYIQLRMVATIGIMRGADLNSDQARTIAFISLLGTSAMVGVGALGAQIGMKLGTRAVTALPGHMLIAINKAVGFRLIVKFGQKGMIRVANVIPLIGGLVSGGLNAYATYHIGHAASHWFKQAHQAGPHTVDGEAEEVKP